MRVRAIRVGVLSLVIVVVAGALVFVAGSAQGRPTAAGNGVIAFAGGRGVSVMRADGSGVRLVRRADGVWDLAWAPDGRKLAFVTRGMAGSAIWVMDADGTDAVRLVARSRTVSGDLLAGVFSPTWSPDGRRIAYSDGVRERDRDVWVMNADGSGKRRLARTRGCSELDVDWSPQGDRLVSTCVWGWGSVGLRLLGADGSAGSNLLARKRDAHEPDWSPDGRRIAFSARAGGSMMPGGMGIYLVSAAGGSPARFVSHGKQTMDRSPTWSPDGRRIAFARDSFRVEDGVTYAQPPAGIYVINADGTGVTRLRSSPAGVRLSPAWQPIPQARLAGRWVIRDLGTLGGPGAYARAINDHGQIVGAAEIGPLVGGQHAFLWEHGKMRDLGAAFGGPGSRAEAVNERGQVVGAADTKTVAAKTGHHVTHAFLWENGKMRDLGNLPGKQSSYAVAVNERGQVLGASCDSAGDHCRAFLWQQGTMTDLGALGPHYVFWPLAINDRGQVIGTVDTQAKYVIPGFWSLSGIPQAFVWQNGRVTKLGALGGPGSWAVAVNERGQVVGSADTTRKTERGWGAGMPVRHAFLWEHGKMRDLGTLGGEASGAVAVNDRGQVIGWSDTKARVQHVFLWQNGKMRDLGAGYGGGDYQPAINERGQIVGSNCHSVATRCRAFLWQNGKMTDLGALGDAFPESTAVAINGRNLILGQVWSPGSHAQHAVLWTKTG